MWIVANRIDVELVVAVLFEFLIWKYYLLRGVLNRKGGCTESQKCITYFYNHSEIMEALKEAQS